MAKKKESKLKRKFICPKCRRKTVARSRCPVCNTEMISVELDAMFTDGTVERTSMDGRNPAW